MTLLIAASVLTNYRNQLELHGLPVRETVAAYVQKITDAAIAHLEQQSADGWQVNGWSYHADPSPDYHYQGVWIDPFLSADITIPFVRTVAALGYDPSTFLSHHIHAAEKNLRSLAPEEPAVFDLPPQRLDGSVGTYPTEDLRSIDPREAFDKPPRRDNDPSP